MKDIIKVENLYMKYKKKDNHYSLENLNFSIKEGEFHAFIGENGAGKSTAIKILTGLNDDFDGNIFINDLNVKKDFNARKNLCYIPDKTSFPNDMNVYQFLYEFALLVRDDKEGLKVELDSLIKRFDLENSINRNPNQLSSGQMKKVFLIKTIIEKAKIIILDEPAAFLDPSTRMQFFETLKELNQQGVTIFISSHISNR